MKPENWNQLACKPDVSINKEVFAQQIAGNEKAWQAALDFMKRENLHTLENGRYDLSDGTYVAVSEYTTKDPQTAKYEIHRKYIDIQYVAEGEEYIEVLPANIFKEEQQYNADKDIVFFEENPEGNKLYANKDHFFIFFPDEAHKPGLQIQEKGTVKKIVVKIPYKENAD